MIGRLTLSMHTVVESQINYLINGDKRAIDETGPVGRISDGNAWHESRNRKLLSQNIK